MDIGVIGSGHIGSALARHLMARGHRVSIAIKVLGLIDALGFDGLDAGPLADSWRQQPGSPAYCRDLDVTGLMAGLAKADAAQIAAYRDQADEAARAYFLGEPAAKKDP
jgi:predicted dinucleotide-binding enzyme